MFVLNRISALIALTLFVIASAQAEVVDATAHGFQIRQKVAMKAPPETIWRLMTAHVGEWWHPDHTYSGDARNLYIEPTALGCFCENIGKDGSVAHLVVTFVNPNEMIRFTGGLGPLGLMGIDGNMTISLEPGDGLTIATLDYQVGGYTPGGLESIAAAVDSVLGDALARLRRFVETGQP